MRAAARDDEQDDTMTDDELKAIMADVEQDRDNFLDPDGWQLSKRGNVWREWLGFRLTIYTRWDGLYAYSVADPGGKVSYSQRGFGHVEDAMEQLWDDHFAPTVDLKGP